MTTLRHSRADPSSRCNAPPNAHAGKSNTKHCTAPLDAEVRDQLQVRGTRWRPTPCYSRRRVSTGRVLSVCCSSSCVPAVSTRCCYHSAMSGMRESCISPQPGLRNSAHSRVRFLCCPPENAFAFAAGEQYVLLLLLLLP